MTLQITKNSFIYNGKEYTFGNIHFIVYIPKCDKVTITMGAATNYRVIILQNEHVSALMLAFSRWANSR